MSLIDACREGGGPLDVLNCPPIVPSREMATYEALWTPQKATFKTLAEIFRSNPKSAPSVLVSDEELQSVLSQNPIHGRRPSGRASTYARRGPRRSRAVGRD